uniref:CCHC-type domain-containing protein n=1 Tax=Amphimedon queenslandica TaxID=400682 RepID=A0A1X7TMG4_AMPQE
MQKLKGQMEILCSITIPATPALEGEPPKWEPKDAVKLTKRTEGEDIEAYLKTFERLMEAYEVPKERWAYRLAPQLTGKAQQAYTAVTSDSAKYDEVKTTILRRYKSNEETYKSRFRSSRRKEGDSYIELAIRMCDFLERRTVGCRSMAELREKMLLKQLHNVMPPELRIWVNERKPMSADEAATLANYMTARRMTGKNWKETGGKEKTGEDSIKQKGGADSRMCHVCKQIGHLAYNCPTKSEREDASTKDEETEKRKPTLRNVKCYSCGNLGHMSMQCPDKAWFCGGGIPK